MKFTSAVIAAVALLAAAMDPASAQQRELRKGKKSGSSGSGSGSMSMSMSKSKSKKKKSSPVSLEDRIKILEGLS